MKSTAIFLIISIVLSGCISTAPKPMYPREGPKPEKKYCVDTPYGHRIALPL